MAIGEEIPPKIVIIGGGAGGLELATKLGKNLGKRDWAQVTLVDSNRTHLWKPLLHEVATGALDTGIGALSYRAHAANHGFEFRLGSLTNIDRPSKCITLSPVVDETGFEVLPERTIEYDYLVVAIGSISNDFNTPGVSEHAILLDNLDKAYKFHDNLFNQFVHFEGADSEASVNIAIVGAGATGVELAAELYNTVKHLSDYGFKKLTPDSLKVTVIEASDRVLPPLPSRIAEAVHHDLTKMGVEIKTNTMVTEARAEGFQTKDKGMIAADLMVWAAGVKCPDFMRDIGGLETNRINQLAVHKTLQTTRDPNIFAIGDCAACPMSEEGKFVPPRAQSAHQMASHAYKNIIALMGDKKLKDYAYRDFGSLVSMSEFGTVGDLLGKKGKRPIFVGGRIARVMYLSLYQMHQMAIHGLVKCGALILLGNINRMVRPRIKLH